MAEEHEETVDSDDGRMDPALPPNVSMARDVMERCIHLLSMSSPRLRLKVPCFIGYNHHCNVQGH